MDDQILKYQIYLLNLSLSTCFWIIHEQLEINLQSLPSSYKLLQYFHLKNYHNKHVVFSRTKI